MISLDDPLWKTLEGGYRLPYDASVPLRAMEQGADVWGQLWEALHHQADVGVASYAAVPHIVRIASQMPERDWNLYALLSCIEVERHALDNPPMPEWLAADYRSAWEQALALALADLTLPQDTEGVLSILGLVAIAKGHRKLGDIILAMDTSTIDEMAEGQTAWSSRYRHSESMDL